MKIDFCYVHFLKELLTIALGKICGKNIKNLEKALEEIKNAVKISENPVTCNSLIHEVIQ